MDTESPASALEPTSAQKMDVQLPTPAGRKRTAEGFDIDVTPRSDEAQVGQTTEAGASDKYSAGTHDNSHGRTKQ